MKYFVAFIYFLLFATVYTVLYVSTRNIESHFNNEKAAALHYAFFALVIIVFYIRKSQFTYKESISVGFIFIVFLLTYLYDFLYFLIFEGQKVLSVKINSLKVTHLEPIVFSPILEELFFRHFLWRFLPAGDNKFQKIIFISVLFATLHLNNVFSLSASFLFSVLVTYGYSSRLSIAECILIHVLYNFLSFLFYFQMG